MAGPKITDDERELLTEEELAGMEEDDGAGEGEGEDGDDGEGADDAADAPDDKSGGEDGAADDADPAKPDDEGTKGADDAAAAAAAAAAKEAEKAQQQPAPVVPDWKQPENAQQSLTDIDTKLDDLAAKFDDGELTASEYRAAIKPLEQERDQIKESVFKANLAHDQNIATWTKVHVPSFLRDHPEYQPPRTDAEGKAIPPSESFRLLDMIVREIQSDQNTANPLDPAILEQAHARLQSAFGRAPAAAPGRQTPPPRGQMPPSLAHVPAASATELEGNRFAHLDRLTGTAFEDALAKLPEADREAYLSQ